MFFKSKLALIAAALTLSAAPSLRAQQPAPAPPQPLTSMPYSPTLDLASLDRTVDPCVDLYKFSCGGWMAKNPIPPDQAGWDVYSKLANDNQQFLWGILQQDAQAPSRTPVQQKVGDYFASCMNTQSIDALGEKPLPPFLAQLDAIKSRPDLPRAPLGGTFHFGSGLDAINSRPASRMSTHPPGG